MKKYVFRLETVRRVRRAQENIAKSDLLIANTEVTKAIEAVQDRTVQYEASQSANLTQAGVDQFMKQRYFNGLHGAAVIAARASQRAAEMEASVKRELYIEAAKRTNALNRLDERRHDEYLIEARRQEEREVDDIVTGRHMRKNAG